MNPDKAVQPVPTISSSIMKWVLQKMRNQKRLFKNLRWQARDLYNRRKYGPEAPLSCEKISVDPRAITHAIDGGSISRSDSGLVLGGDWDVNLVEIEKSPKYRICHERFVNGKTWEEARAYQLMVDLIKKQPGVDRCRTMDDIIKRYELVDVLYHDMAKEKKLLSRSEIDPGNFRERVVYMYTLTESAKLFLGMAVGTGLR